MSIDPATAAIAQATRAPAADPALDKSTATTLLRTMLYARIIDERLIRLYKQGQIQGGVYCGIGQEAIGAATTAAGKPQDLYAPLIRNMAVHVGRGETLQTIFRQWLGRASGPTRGHDGNIHYGSLENGLYAMISHLGAMIPVVVGGVMAKRRQGSDAIGFAYIGDGGTSTGDFHEAANFAAVFSVPVIIVIESNKYAYSMPSEQQYKCRQLIDRAAGYGMEGFSVDGNDVLEVYQLMRRVADDIRVRPRPVMIECDTMRMRGHGEHDDFAYAPPELLERYRQRDPLTVATRQMTDSGILTQAEIQALNDTCLHEVDLAYHAALEEPPPSPDMLGVGVYADA